jgi:hypothetical protein
VHLTVGPDDGLRRVSAAVSAAPAKLQPSYQIAWFSDVADDGTIHNLLHGIEYNGHAGNFDFVPHVYPGMSKTSVSWRISDHYPLWVEFALTKT